MAPDRPDLYHHTLPVQGSEPLGALGGLIHLAGNDQQYILAVDSEVFLNGFAALCPGLPGGQANLYEFAVGKQGHGTGALQ